MEILKVSFDQDSCPMIIDISITELIIFALLFGVGYGVSQTIFDELIKPQLDKIFKKRGSK